jgi:cell division protein FtsI/penicillin-binding protein 2
MRPEPARPGPRRSAAVALAGTLAGLVAMPGLVACSRSESPDPTLTAFLDGWRSGKLDAVAFVTPDGKPVPAVEVTNEITSLSGDLAKTPPTLRVSQKPKVSKDLANAEIDVAWPVGQDVVWEYAAPVKLARDKGKWRMVWTPAVVHPQLTKGDELAVKRTPAARGAILDGSGAPVVEARPVVDVGIQPDKVKDLPALMKELSAAFASIGEPQDLSDLPGRVAAAKPNAFVEVVTLRQPAYEKIRERIHPLDGTVFVERTMHLALTREFARALLGTVGEVTKEIMDASPGRYAVGDQVGLSGLQRQYDDRLRGAPGVSVVLSRIDAEGKDNQTPLWDSAPKPGTALKTTLDPKVQQAADTALAGQGKRAALVAMRISDGAVLAVANGPGVQGVNLALTAQVPPGSTFKMVTSVGLLDAGAVTLDTPVNCPKTLAVEGRVFKNSHDFELGTVPFRVDFAKSCNTAFASLAPRLGPNGLADAAKTVGIGLPWDLGVDVNTGKVSAGGSGAERAAAAFGQGQTQLSPMALAAAAAAVARGQWQQPKLITDPAPASPAANGPQLKPSTVGPLRTMMREVVTSGTGKALADVPGQPVFGKTGTAEYDNVPAHAHAWFVGWQADIAFAVFVEAGGDSTAASVPLAEVFLRNLARS